MATTGATQPDRQPVTVVATVTYTPGAIERLAGEHGSPVTTDMLVRYLTAEINESPSVRLGGTGVIVSTSLAEHVPAFAELRRIADDIDATIAQGVSDPDTIQELRIVRGQLSSVLAKLGA